MITTYAALLTLGILIGLLLHRCRADAAVTRAETAAQQAQRSADVAGRMAGIAAFDSKGVRR